MEKLFYKVHPETHVLQMRIERLERVVKVLLEYFQDQVDVNYEGTGPNREMRLVQEIEEALRKL